MLASEAIDILHRALKCAPYLRIAQEHAAPPADPPRHVYGLRIVASRRCASAGKLEHPRRRRSAGRSVAKAAALGGVGSPLPAGCRPLTVALARAAMRRACVFVRRQAGSRGQRGRTPPRQPSPGRAAWDPPKPPPPSRTLRSRRAPSRSRRAPSRSRRAPSRSRRAPSRSRRAPSPQSQPRRVRSGLIGTCPGCARTRSSHAPTAGTAARSKPTSPAVCVYA
jgi:hypothetical protein